VKTKIFNGDYKMTSPYGWRVLNGKKEFHNGVDFSMPIGTDLIVPDTFNGAKVRINTADKFGGKYIQLVRADGKGCYYLHNSKNLLKVGAVVKTGQIIAKSGNSGNTTGAHVHFGVQKKATVWGSHEDPMPYIVLTDLAKGGRVKFTNDMNIREGSGTKYKVTGTAKKGSVGEIKDGPRIADGFTWWDIYWADFNGWVADTSYNEPTKDDVTNVDGTPVVIPQPPVPVDPCEELKKQIVVLELQLQDIEKELEKKDTEIERLKKYENFYNELSKCLVVKEV